MPGDDGDHAKRATADGNAHPRRERIVDAIEEWSIAHGRPPRSSDWRCRAPGGRGRRPTASHVVDTFGSWDAALEAAGIMPAKPPPASNDRRDWILAAIRRWNDLHDEPPRWDDWRVRQPGWPTTNDVRREFGGLSAAVEAAGLEPRRPGQRAYRANDDRAEILDAIRRWTAIHGRPPRRLDWDPWEATARGKPELADRSNDGTWPRAERVKRLFGSWSKAIEAAGARDPRDVPLRIVDRRGGPDSRATEQPDPAAQRSRRACPATPGTIPTRLHELAREPAAPYSPTHAWQGHGGGHARPRSRLLRRPRRPRGQAA